MIKKEEKLRNLTKKFFMRQKIEEIGLALFILIVPFLIGTLIYSFKDTSYSSVCEITLSPDVVCSSLNFLFSTWMLGLFPVALLVLFGVFMYLIIIPVITNWIESNWIKADQRARKKLGMEVKEEHTSWDSWTW